MFRISFRFPFMSAFLYAVLVWASIGLPRAQADEIDKIKNKVKAFYEEVIPKYHKIAENSHLAAKKEIEGQDSAVIGSIDRAFMRSITNYFSAYQGVDTCLDNGSELYGAIIDRKQQEPADPAARAAFRKSFYDYEAMTHTFDLVNAYQRNYAACHQPLVNAESSLQALDQLKSLKIDLCKITKTRNVEAYNNVLRTNQIPAQSMSKLDAKFFLSWPSITLTIGQRLDCVASLDGDKEKKDEKADPTKPKDDESKTCTYGSLEAENNNRAATDGWAQVRAGSPFLVAAAFYYVSINTTLWGTSALPTGAAQGWAAVVVVAVQLIEAAYVNYENKQRVEKINDYIDQKEREIRAIRENEFISFSQFENLRDGMCPKTQTDFNTLVASRLAPVDTAEGLRKILDYRKVSDEISLWFGELFNFLVKERSGAFITEAIANELEAKKNEFYSSIYDAKASQNLAAEINKINSVQATISEFRCSGLNTRDKFLLKKAIRTRMQQFKDTCDLQVRSFAPITAPLVLASESSSTIVCADERLDSPLATLEIVPEAEGARLLVKGEGQQLIGEVTGVTPANITEKAGSIVGLRCQLTGAVEMGTDLRFKSSVYNFGPAPMTEGLGLDRQKSLLATLLDAQKRIHRKATICKRQLQESDPLALAPSLCNSIAF